MRCRARAFWLAALWSVAMLRPASAKSTTVPMTLANNHVYVDVMLDRTGPYHFILDSGSPFGLLDTDVAHRLGLVVRPHGTIGGVGNATPLAGATVVHALSIGGRAIADRKFVVTPLRVAIGAAEGRSVDGIIGRNFLESVVTTIDYEHATVTLDADFAAAMHDGASALPLRFYGGLPQIACRVAEVEGRCTVDTGSRLGASVLGPFVAKHPSLTPADATAIGVDGFGFGGAAYGRLARLSTLAFGNFVLRDTICDYSTQKTGAFADGTTAANLGGAVWRRFALTFDYAGRRIALKPQAFDERERFDRSGLFLIGDEDDTIAVLDVRPGTPAFDAGVRARDRIVASDDIELNARDLSALRDVLSDATRASVTLQFIRNGTLHTVAVRLRDYVDDRAVRSTASDVDRTDSIKT